MYKDPSNLVIRPETALKLQDAGIVAPSFFAYFQDQDLNYFVFLQTPFKTGLPAYTSGELIEIMPGAIGIDCDTYMAQSFGWAQITEAQYDSYTLAHLQTVKHALYHCGYYYQGKMIAYKETTTSAYRNLFSHGETEQEARAAMLLMLIQEHKFPV